MPTQFGAAFLGPNSPAAVQLRHSEQLSNKVVQGLRDALNSAVKETNSPKDKALKEQVSQIGRWR